ncbi:hypothetical protein BDZ97DRAFT_1914191 [Flammula alnicola]|nr:hypothetical protein BDZ97DRAFT_1914191 [Flammula alnicola]
MASLSAGPTELNAIISPISQDSLCDENEKLAWHSKPQRPFIETHFAAPKPEYDDASFEASDSAFVWKIYNEESAKADAAIVEASNRSIDVLLVFTGLFSAVLTTFIIQSYQLLIPGPFDATNALLAQFISSQSGALNGTVVSMQATGATATDPGPSLLELRWVNGLWFAALAFSLSAALFCMLGKQWLQSSPNISGSPRHRARQRQRRYMQLQAWHVMTIINALPLLLHATLLLFFAGLIVLLWSGNLVITAVTCVIVALVYACYFGSMSLSLLYPDCPYQHPISEQLRLWMKRKNNSLADSYFEDIEQASQTDFNPWREQEPDVIPDHVDPDDCLDASAFVWLLENCPNGIATSVTLQAIGGLPRSFSAFHVLRKAGAVSLVLKEFRACFHRDSTLDSQWYILQPQDAEKYCRAWMRMTYGTSKQWPTELLKLLETLEKTETTDNINAIAACTRAIAHLDSRDGRPIILPRLRRHAEGRIDFSHEMLCWLLDTFLQCSLVSQLHFRPKDHIVKEAVPVLLRLLHLTKHTLASNVRSAIALSLSYMTNEFSRLASLVLTPTNQSADRKRLKPIAQRGLSKLYVDGRISHVSDDVLADVLQILYPPVMIARGECSLFVKSLLHALWSSTQPEVLFGSVLRLLEPLLLDSQLSVVDAFIEGKGIAALLRVAHTGDTASRHLQLDCMRNLCLFIRSTAEHHHYSRLGHGSDCVNEDRLDHIFRSDFFSTLIPIIAARRWWLPEIAEIWVPALVKLCQLRPYEPVWRGVEAALRKFSDFYEGKDGYYQLINDLDEMKALTESAACQVAHKF